MRDAHRASGVAWRCIHTLLLQVAYACSLRLHVLHGGLMLLLHVLHVGLLLLLHVLHVGLLLLHILHRLLMKPVQVAALLKPMYVHLLRHVLQRLLLIHV